MKSVYTNLVGLMVLASLSACGTSRNGPIVTQVSAKKILSSSAPATEKSEELAKGAEELLTVQGFAQANEMAELALTVDPNNFRAEFIKVMTAPLVLQKGLYARVRPLAEQSAKVTAIFDRIISESKEANDSQAKYLLDGTPEIRTERELQVHLDRVLESLEELRRFARSNRDRELSVRASSLLVPNIADRYANACEITMTEKYEYELKCPSEQARFYVTLNRADFEAIRGLAGYAQIYLTLGAAYDVTDGVRKFEPWINLDTLNPQEMTESLLSTPAFAKLRGENRLSRLKEMGTDIAASLSWAMANKTTLCPKGSDDPRNRVGFWLNGGLCIDTYFQPYVTVIETFSRGQTMTASAVINGTGLDITHNGYLFLTQPIKDFRDVGPIRFSKCKMLESVGDPSLGGMLPNRDFNNILALAGTCP